MTGMVLVPLSRAESRDLFPAVTVSSVLLVRRTGCFDLKQSVINLRISLSRLLSARHLALDFSDRDFLGFPISLSESLIFFKRRSVLNGTVASIPASRLGSTSGAEVRSPDDGRGVRGSVRLDMPSQYSRSSYHFGAPLDTRADYRSFFGRSCGSPTSMHSTTGRRFGPRRARSLLCENLVPRGARTPA